MGIRQNISSEEISRAIRGLAESIASRHQSTQNLVLAGIANGGIPFCNLLKAEIESIANREIHSATIDVSFHRDDIGINPITKSVEATELALDPEEAVIILVDDVLFSGRTIRAALSEVHSIGRPHKIELAVLVDRGNRLLPISADYIGITVATNPDENVEVHLDTEDPSKSHVDILSS